MFRSLAVLLLLSSSLAFAEGEKYGNLHLISFDHFKNLPSEERVKYLAELRQFFVNQELKRAGKTYGATTTDTIKDLMAEFFINEANAAGVASQRKSNTVVKPLKKPEVPVGENLLPQPADTAAVAEPLDTLGGGGTDTANTGANAPAQTTRSLTEDDGFVPATSLTVEGKKEKFCSFEKPLNPTQKKLVETSDRCVIGGYMICMSFNDKGRFGCWKNDEYRNISKNNKCDADKGEYSCAPPLYLTKTGEPLCVASPGHAPVSKACENAKDGMSLQELQKHISKPEFKKQYRALKDRLEDYCRNDGKDALYFDMGDCKSLNHRLAQIASPSKEKPDGAICKEKITIEGQPIFLSLKQNKEAALSLEPSFKPKDWTVGRCFENLKVKSRTEGSPSMSYSENCLIGESAETGYTEVYAFKDGTCSIQHAYITKASPTDFENDQCKLIMLNPGRENGFTVYAYPEKAVYQKDTGDESELTKMDSEKAAFYQAKLEDKNNFLNVFYNKEAKLSSDRCWASEVTIIPGKRLTPAGITARGAAAEDSLFDPSERTERGK